jgi:hypothetical protein
VQWAANIATAVHAAPGLYSITGLQTTAGGYSMVFQLGNIGGPGTYALGTTQQMFGGAVSVSHTTLGGWSTPLNGAAGEFVVSTLTATRMTGAFNFTATPLTGAATTPLAVTNGAFDIAVTGNPGALPANAGRRITATIGGASFNAAAASVILTTGASPTLTIVGNNSERTVTISLMNVTAAGTFPLSSALPIRTLQVGGAPGNPLASWASQATGGSGTVIVSSLTASRIVGSFTATLVPLGGGATGTITVTGNFDMGR